MTSQQQLLRTIKLAMGLSVAFGITVGLFIGWMIWT